MILSTICLSMGHQLCNVFIRTQCYLE